ncbi:unnamed protein product [Mytilus coruscus]|uniref:Fibronectin type-III domain-containing protein n=1 Tax=Mytilus coruscus TaxID=42192 RepID=A0A6J8CX03_MYTCO|nr:unnamed protein product [Mytilus coruscus]
MDEKEIPALGRPFELGMLYDCRKNNLITNSRIWDVKEKKSILLHIVNLKDTISAKTSFLDINSDLKLSILCGLVEVHGSAKYLENQRKFTRQSRVTFKYRCRTHFKELQIKEIMSEQQIHSEILNSGNASHVVAGILYGVDAIFVFDRNSSDEEDELQIHRKLEAMVKYFSKASVESNTDERKNKLLDNVKFTYHGDIPLDSEPKSFEEAIAAFKTLPNKIRQKDAKCVPMSVLLIPLHRLTNSTVTLNEPLHVSLVNQIQETFEKFAVLKMKCNDLTARPTCQYDERYRHKVDEMQAIVEQSEQRLKSQLSSKVTAVTPTDLIKGNVRNLLDEYDKLPKSPEKLDNNLSEIRTVINVLDTCVRKIPSFNKDSQSNTQEDNKNQSSQNFGQFELPPIENFLGDLQEDDNRTAPQRKQFLRNNISSIGKTMKKDIDMFVSKCNEKENNYIEQPNVQQGAHVELCADDVRSRQKVDNMQTPVEQPKQKLKSQLSSEVTAVTTIDVVKGKAGNLLEEYEKSPKSPKTLNNKLSEMRTVINVLDTSVRTIPSSNKDIKSNTQEDNINQSSQDIRQFELPLIENFVGDQQEEVIYNRTDAQRKCPRRNPVKKDRDMFVSKFTKIENNYIEKSYVKRDADVEPSIPLIPGKPSAIRTHIQEIEITWEPPPNVPDDYSYEVSYRYSSHEEWIILPYHVKNSSVRLSEVFWFAQPYYFFRVRCLCDGVYGHYSEVSSMFLTEYCIIL